MSWRSRVVWSQGMFLQPHHFQQEGRFLERQLHARLRAARPYAWGFERLAIDEAALALGKVAISDAAGVLPDGTAFAVPDLDPLPAPFDVPADMRDEVVCLALPIARPGSIEFDFDAPTTSANGSLTRYRAEELTAQDQTSVSDTSASIQVGRLRLRIVRTREATDAFAVLGCARVAQRRPDNQVVLQREYIPPQFTIGATAQLSQTASLLHGLLAQRAQALAARMGQLGHGVSEVAHFLMLQMFNRFEALFSQHARLGNCHPQALYESCLALAGEFSTFVGANRRPSTFPTYNHDDPAACFDVVVTELRDLFSRGLEETAIAIELVDRKFGVRTAAVTDLELARSAAFVLAVNAQMPGEQLRSRFLAQSKIGPVERIRDLVNLQLPGIALRNMPVAPRQLPFHAGYFYFELERGGELWKQFEKVGNLAIHVAGEFPGLEMQLWAIRQNA